MQIGAVLIATISFILWVYATHGYFPYLKLPASVPGLVSVLIGAWTFLLPYFYKGESDV